MSEAPAVLVPCRGNTYPAEDGRRYGERTTKSAICPEASQMEIHVLSSCFSCSLNTDIAVMALDPSLGFLITWSTSGPPQALGA